MPTAGGEVGQSTTYRTLVPNARPHKIIIIIKQKNSERCVLADAILLTTQKQKQYQMFQHVGYLQRSQCGRFFDAYILLAVSAESGSKQFVFIICKWMQYSSKRKSGLPIYLSMVHSCEDGGLLLPVQRPLNGLMSHFKRGRRATGLEFQYCPVIGRGMESYAFSFPPLKGVNVTAVLRPMPFGSIVTSPER